MKDANVPVPDQSIIFKGLKDTRNKFKELLEITAGGPGAKVDLPAGVGVDLRALMGDRIKNYCVSRIYANGQTAGQCGSAHPDDGDLTFLYYPNPEWNYEWQGHLIFMENESNKLPEGNNFVNPNMETSRIVSYKPNRAVLFPGSIWHYADAPSRFFNGLRISLAYKLWI